MTKGDYGGQRRNMEDDSMVGTLRYQAELIWPLEREILVREKTTRVLDIGCGTGEILRRVKSELAPSLAVGIDLFRGHLRHAEPPVVHGDAFHLPFADATFDLVCVRHVLQAIPDPVGLLREARRVLVSGGRLHLLVEDYQAIFFDVDDYETEEHFREVTKPFRGKGTDLYQGRRAFRHLRAAGFTELAMDPILVDTHTGNRDAFAGVFRHWRAGYAKTLAALVGKTEAEMQRRFDLMIEAIRDPERYTAWLLFCWTARR